MKKKAVVIHSGGMDSSICLALAIREFGVDKVLSITFDYKQRHSPELEQAKKICSDWKVDHVVITIECLKEITTNAQLDHNIPIIHEQDKPPNTLCVGRNGLMAHLGGIHAEHLGANCIYMGILELESANSGYRDCSRMYMDLQQEILRIDLDKPDFEIRTPLVRCTKKETLEVANQLGVLSYLLKETITCYEGVQYQGCRKCPACKLRNDGIKEYVKANPSFVAPYKV